VAILLFAFEGHVRKQFGMGSHDDEICVALTCMTLAGDGVVLGLGMLYLAVKAWLKYRSHQQAFNVVKDTQLMNIADLHTLVLDQAINDSVLAISNHYVRTNTKQNPILYFFFINNAMLFIQIVST